MVNKNLYSGKSVLLIICGGIAAYKALDLIRTLRTELINVHTVLTKSGAEFVTPLSLRTLSGNMVHENTFSSYQDIGSIGHIELSRSVDSLIVAPATANIMAKMAYGIADDLASAILLANDKPIILAPAMNVRMWENPATQTNLKILESRGITFVGPESGDMACGEIGMGRMAEPRHILEAVNLLISNRRSLTGHRALVTSGPTYEAIDPVRYITNRSSGKQGHAIASSLAALGAHTTLVTGPMELPDPKGVSVIHVESAREMLSACESALPADVAICAAAVADWRPENNTLEKIKKKSGTSISPLELVENPDILHNLSCAKHLRPRLVIGFAAETSNIIENAIEKRKLKQCDWIVANDVSIQAGTIGGDENTVHIVKDGEIENWPKLSKVDVAKRLAEKIASTLDGKS